MLPLGGSWVAYVPAPNNAGSTAADPPPSEDKRRPVIDAAEADFTVVFEKLNGDCLRCQVCYCAADIMRIAYVRAACCFSQRFSRSDQHRSGSPHGCRGCLRAASRRACKLLLTCMLADKQHSSVSSASRCASVTPAHTPRQHWRHSAPRQPRAIPLVTPCPDIPVSNGSFSLYIPADTVITVTTTFGQHKAAPVAVPLDAPFPLPHSDSYDGLPGQPAQVCLCVACRVACLLFGMREVSPGGHSFAVPC